MTVPTLDELLQQLKKDVPHRDACVTYFRMVASGQAPPLLRGDNAILAAQAMSVLLNHVAKDVKPTGG